MDDFTTPPEGVLSGVDNSFGSKEELEARLGLPYIQQTEEKGYACCSMIAILNASIFYGGKTFRPEDEAWEMMVDACSCRHGAALNTDWLERHLKLKTIPIPPSRKVFDYVLELAAPIIVRIDDDLSRVGFHAALVVGKSTSGDYMVVNLNSFKGDLITPVVPAQLWNGIGDPLPDALWRFPLAVLKAPVGRSFWPGPDNQ